MKPAIFSIIIFSLFLSSSFASISADPCSNYKAYSTSVTDAFCQDQACRQYCMKGQDVEKCMKFVYEDSFKLCQSIDGSVPTPTDAPVESTSSQPPSTRSVPIQPPPETLDPRECATWGSPYPAYQEWCQATACPSCDEQDEDAPFQACLEHSKVYCTFPGSSDGSPTNPEHSDCQSWTGIDSVYDDYCRGQACATCNQYGDQATREACYDSQKGFCNVPRLTAPQPTNAPPTQTTSSSSAVSTASNAPPSNDGSTFSKRVVYLDWSIGDIEDSIRTSVDNGFNVIVVGFWLYKHDPSAKMDSYWDAAEQWMNLPSTQRDEILTYAHSKGAELILTVGGATENHAVLMNSGLSGSDYGKMCAEKVIESGLDGLDFDSEGWGPQDFSGKKGTQWLIDATRAARSILPADKTISHAPQGPYFSTSWAGQGGYGEINRQVGDMIDYYYVQFYNQGASNPYNSYSTLFESAQGASIKEIIAQGVPQKKIVVGKYITGNGGDGYTNPETLKQILCQGHQDIGFTAGGGVWMYDTRQMEETKQFGQALSSKC